MVAAMANRLKQQVFLYYLPQSLYCLNQPDTRFPRTPKLVCEYSSIKKFAFISTVGIHEISYKLLMISIGLGRESLLKGRSSLFYLLVLASLDQLLFKLTKYIFYLKIYFNKMVNCTELFLK
jgi:hypothetical protein